MLDKFKDKSVYDFTATENVKKILEALKFNNKKSYALLRIPTFTTKAFKISKLSNKESKIFCDQKNIFIHKHESFSFKKSKQRNIFNI